MKDFKAELTAALKQALANASTDPSRTCQDKIVIPVNVAATSKIVRGNREWTPGLHFQLTLWNCQEAIQTALDGVRRIPGSSPLPCAKVRTPGDGPDYADVALDIYGNATTAADKLQAQLDNKEELELDNNAQNRLFELIYGLRERAEATSDPVLQRTARVTKLIEEMRARKAIAENVKRTRAGIVAADAHSSMPELRRLIAEHEAVNVERGIVNDTAQLSGKFVPGFSKADVTPMVFNPAYSHGVKLKGKEGAAGSAYRNIQNTKHNVAIRALQETIARSLGVWSHHTKKVTLERYWQGDSNLSLPPMQAAA